MGKQLNPRQLRFVNEYMKSAVASRAYAAAGYQVTTRNALDANSSRLLNHDKVQAEIRHRRAMAARRTSITLQDLVADAEEARQLALETKQPGAALQATQLQGKLLGLLVERKEQGQPGDFDAARDRQAILDRVKAEIGPEAVAFLQDQLARQDATQAQADDTARLPSDSLN